MKKLNWIEERCAITDALGLLPECDIETIIKMIELIKEQRRKA